VPQRPQSVAGALTFALGKGKLPDSQASPDLPGSWRLRNLAGDSPGLSAELLLMAESQISYTLDSTLQTVDSAEKAACRMATESGFDEDEVARIAMAVREACINAVLHGNAYDPGKKVKMELQRTGQNLVITIRDEGKGLNLDQIPDPLAPENLLKTSGRGIFLMRSFMDEVEIHPSQTGTEIKLIKHVHGAPAGGKEASS
jgi:serine/threonine-protein kinase RsbW